MPASEKPVSFLSSVHSPYCEHGLMPEVGVFASVVTQKVEAGEARASGKGKCEVRGACACACMCVSVWFL